MTPRSIRRAAERKANKQARKAIASSGAAVPASALLTRGETPTLFAAQLLANRANSQRSTGPSTELGKAASSRNALLPAEDAARYQIHIQTYAGHFQPAGPEEHALTQSIADTTWRLARIPGLEMAIFAQGRIAFADEFADQEEAVRPALIEAHTYLAYEKQIRNLHLQEARLVRRREKETAELRRLQQERLAQGTGAPLHQSSASAAHPEIAGPQHATAAGNGFVFASDVIEPLDHASTGEIPSAKAASLHLADAA